MKFFFFANNPLVIVLKINLKGASAGRDGTYQITIRDDEGNELIPPVFRNTYF